MALFKSIECNLYDIIKDIEPTEAQKESIIKSHSYLREVILQPLSFIQNTVLTGSYKRRTLIRPISDVDMFAILDYDSPNKASTPQEILNKIKAELKKNYPNSIIRQDRPCVTADFNHCAFEITPVIIEKKYSWWDNTPYNIYYMPDMKDLNYWIKTESPDILGEKLTAANQSLEGKLIPLIKLMKCWKKYKNIHWLKSYEMEEKAIQHFSNYSKISSWREGVTELYCLYNSIGWWDKWTLKDLSDDDFAKKCEDWFGYYFE